MRAIFYFTAILCTFVIQPAFAQQSVPDRYALSIKVDGLYNHVEALTDRKLQGRRMGSQGMKEATGYIAQQLQKMGLAKPFPQGYYQYFEHEGEKGANIIAKVEGTDLRYETVVIMAHYDYIGAYNGLVFPGAEDNASGVAALLELAATFQKAKNEGFSPRRTILFAFFDGNKQDLAGSTYYMNNPLFKPESTVLAINLDMLGRTDGYAEGVDDYVFVLGADRLSSNLKHVVDSLNDEYIQMIVDHSFYNSEILFKLFYPMSDHVSFEKRFIPVLQFTSGVTGDIHDVGDVIDKLSFPTFMRRTRLIYHVAWWYASQGVWPDIKSTADKK